MKKIIFLVLVLVFGFNTLFAETNALESDGFIYMFDDENQPNDFSGFDDLGIISLIAYHAPKTFGSKKLTIYKSTIYNEPFELTDKYYSVYVFNEDRDFFAILENIGDGRYAEIVFRMYDE